MNEYLLKNLSANGFQRAKLALNNGAVYAQTAGSRATVLLYLQEPSGLKGNVDQFASVRNTVLEAFVNSGFTEARCLTLIESWRVPELAREEAKLAPVWFIDLQTQKLMIYEGTAPGFDGVRSIVEGALTEARMNSRQSQPYEGQPYQSQPYQGQPYQSQPYQGQPYQSQPYQSQPNQGRPYGGAVSGGGRKIRPRKWRTFKEFIEYQGLCNVSIVALNVLIWVVMEMFGNTQDSYYMAMHGAVYTPWIINGMKLYTLITSMFLHFGLSHLFGNMLVLFFLGDNLERAVGHVKYLLIYLGAGLVGNLISCGIELMTGQYSIAAGASGAIFGAVGGLLVVVIRNHGKLEDMNTWKLGLFIAYTLYSGFTSSGVDNAAHVGGLLAGMLLAAIVYRKKQTAAPDQPAAR